MKKFLSNIKNRFKQSLIPKLFFGTLHQPNRRTGLLLSYQSQKTLLKAERQKINLAAKINELNTRRKKNIIVKKERIINRKIDFVRNGGTQVSFAPFSPIDGYLKKHFLWYQNWHLNPASVKAHWSTATAYTAAIIVFLFIAIEASPFISTANLGPSSTTSRVATIYAESTKQLMKTTKNLPENEKPLLSIYKDNLAIDFSDKESKDAKTTVRTTNTDGNELSFSFTIMQSETKEATPVSQKTNNIAHAADENTDDNIAADKQDLSLAKTDSVKKTDGEQDKITMDISDSLKAEYEIKSDQYSAELKETLIIQNKTVLTSDPDYQLRFKLNLNGLKASSTDNGGFILHDENNNSEVMKIAPPIIEDSNKDSGSVSMEIIGSEAIYTINKAFVDNASFPLYLDPTVTVATSTTTLPTSYSKDRTLFETQTGVLASIYSDGTGLALKTSTDRGNTWSGATAIVTSATADDTGFSGWMDGNGNIHLTYSNNDTNSYIFYRKVSYTPVENTFSVGSEKTVESTGTSQAYPTVSANSLNNIYVAYRYYDGTNYTIRTKVSNDSGDNWSASTTLSTAANTNAAIYPALSLWNDYPVVAYNYQNASIKWNYYSGSTWQAAGWANETITSEVDADIGLEFSLGQETGDNYLHLAWRGSGTNGIRYLKNANSASGWDASSSAITADHADRNPSLGLSGADQNIITLYYSDYVGADSYNIKSATKVGNVAFSSTHSATTTDNANNLSSRATQKSVLPIDKALNFESYNSYMTTPSLAIGSSWTIEASIKFPLPETTSYRILARASSSSYYHVAVNSSGLLGTYKSSFASSGYNISSVSNGWHNITAVGASNQTKFYIDGILVGTSAAQVTSDIIYIGNSTNGNNIGLVDEVRVSNSARYSANFTPDRKYSTDANTLALYHMNEGTGTSISDSSGNSKTATLSSSASWYDRSLMYSDNSSLKFNGTSTSVALGNNAALTYGTNFSAETWFKSSVNNAWMGILARTGGSFFGLSSSGKLDFSTISGTNYIANTVAADNKWHHAVVTFSSGALKIYLDGKEDGSWTGVSVSVTNTNAFLGQNGSSGQYFNGELNEAHIYDKTLTAGEVATKFGYGLEKVGTPEANLQGGWKLDAVNTTAVADFSGNGITGTLSGSYQYKDIPQQTSASGFSPVIFTEGTASPYNLKYAPTAKEFIAGGTNNNWSTANNWLPSGAPAAGDNVIFKVTSPNCTVDSIADNIGSITTTKGYTNTLTFNTHPSLNADTFKINVTGDIVFDGGTIKSYGDVAVSHSGVTDGRGNEYASRNIIIGSQTSFNADGLGFARRAGPGYTSDEIGAAHGGEGGLFGAASKVYGDYSNPVSLGSGSGAGPGGGAIIINSSNSVAINGNLSSNASDTALYLSGASGGSVNISANSITGSGIVSAIGGISTYMNYGGGGGGRIRLNSASNSFAGNITAKGQRYETNSTYAGGAGTIFKKLDGQTYGDLIIDNGDNTPGPRYAQAAHLKLANDTGSYQFDSISFLNYGKLAVDAGQTLALNSGTITGNKYAGVINFGTVTVPNNWSLSYYFAHANGTLGGWTSKNLTIASTGLLTHYRNIASSTYKLDIAGLTGLVIDAGGEINTNEVGFTSASGDGAGICISGGYGTGAGYGGIGGQQATNPSLSNPYGDYSNPISLGSGGCGGGGGGAVILSVAGDISVNGAISSNGSDSAGGGSGGTVNLNATNISGAGLISANGGTSDIYSSGGGGGGRIKLSGSAITSSNLIAKGGNGYNSYYNGSAGTIYTLLESQTYGNLIINGGSVSSHVRRYPGAYLKTKTDTGSYRFDSMTFSNSGKLEILSGQALDITTTTMAGDKTSGMIVAGNITTANDWVINYYYAHKNSTINSLSTKNITITSTGLLTSYFNYDTQAYKIDWQINSLDLQTGGDINVDYKGYYSGYGAGTGSAGSSNLSGSGGGGYGGQGGNAATAGGSAYGSITNPTDIGSGGGDNYGATSGGGSVIINTTTSLNLSGTISSNGEAYDNYTGGGSGGSINLTTPSLTGTGGIVRANGAISGWRGGGGGGGRIAINYANDNYTGTLSSLTKNANGGYISGYPDRTGAAGTIFVKQTASATGDLTINNAVSNTTTKVTPIPTPASFTNVNISTYGRAQINAPMSAEKDLTITSDLTVGANSALVFASDIDGTPANGDWSNLVVAGNVTVTGTITAIGTGFAYNTGPGKGNVVASYGSGGGFGGAGGNSSNGAVGGAVYGTQRDNNYLGSGGGYTTGGAGGGMVKMSIGGNLDLGTTGTINANGNPGGAGGGGGSGGAVQISVGNTLSGSGSSAITAIGGAGGSNGGGGGGGRITLYTASDTYTGAKTVTGGAAGSGASAGSAGTTFSQHSPTSLTMNSPNNAASAQIQKTAFRFNSTDVDGDWIQYKLQIATDDAFTQNVSTFDQTTSQNPTDGGRTAIFSNQDKTTGNVTGSNGYTSGREAVLTMQSNLTQGATYYWRFYAYDPEGVDSFDGTQHWSVASSTRSFTVSAIDHLAFSTPQQETVVTFCSAVMTVNLKDSSNNNIYLTSTDGAKVLGLATDSSTGDFFSDSDCLEPLTNDQLTVAIDTNSANFFYKDTTPSAINGYWNISVSETPDAGWADTSQQIRVRPGDFGSFDVTGAPDTIIAGASFSTPANDITVTIKDIFGNVKTDWTGQIWFYSSDSQAVFANDDTDKYTFTSGIDSDNGTHTFLGSDFTLKTKGSQSLVVHNSEGAQYDEVLGITVSPASLDHFGLNSYPRAATNKFAMSSFSWDTPGYSSAPYTPEVTAYDAYNNIKDDFTGDVWFELYKSSDTAGNPLNSTANYAFDYDYTNHYTFTSGSSLDNGVRAFDGSGFTVVTAANDLRLRVLSSANGGKYTDFTIKVKPQAIDRFAITASPALSRSGQSGDKAVDTILSEDITVTAYDTFGNVKTDYAYDDATKSGMIYFYSSDTSATLPYTKTSSGDSSGCFQFPTESYGSYTFNTTNTPTNYFKFLTGGPQTISASECIDPTSAYATGSDNKFDPRLEGANPTKIAASTGSLPETSDTPNKIFVTNHLPGSTHTALSHTNNSNDLIEASPGHQQATITWTNSFDVPTDTNLDPQVYVYRCTSDCDNEANFSKIVTDPAKISVTPSTQQQYTDTGLTNGTEYSYKLSYAYLRQDASLIESDKSITVSTTPADIAPRDVTATQLDITDGSNPGKIKIEYKLRWNSDVSLAYYNPAGNSWHNATAPAMSGDVGASISGSEELTSHIAYLDPNINFDGQFLQSTFKIRVKVTVGAANTYADSSTLDLDSKNPSGATLIVDATSGGNVDLALNAVDDSNLQMRISTLSDFDGAPWLDYATSYNNFNLDGRDTVYIIYRDQYNNTTQLQQQIYATPQNVSIKDGSSINSDTYRLLVIWDDVSPTPAHYNLFRSTDGNNFSAYDITTKNAAIDINLNTNTSYSYKVQAEDASGNKSALSAAVSSRPGTAPDVTADPLVELFGWKQDVGVRAKITWNTDQNSDSFVAYAKEPLKSGSSLETESGSSEAVQVVGSPDMLSEHEINLYNLEPSTKYYFKVLSKNEIQITGYSEVFSFTTPERILLLISGMKVTDITNNSAFISWTTSKLSTTLVEYGQTTSYGQRIEDSSQNTEHKFKLENLISGDYHLRVSATDVDGNVTISDDYIFNIPPTPTITDISITDIGDDTAKVVWSTNVMANSNVDISGTDGAGSQGNADFTTSHSVTLVGLKAKTSYNLIIRSIDKYGNIALSDQRQITTTADTQAPKINNPKSEISSTGSGDNIKYQLIVSWETDEPSTSKIEFGQGVGNVYESSSKEDLNLNMTHTIIVTDLKANSVYHFRIQSGDKSNNIAYSEDYTVTTPPKEKNIITIIINAIVEPLNNIYQGVINKIFKK